MIPLGDFAIDTHVHILRKDAELSPRRHSEPAGDATIEQLIANLDFAGLSHALITAPSFYGTDNRILFDTVASVPDRVLGTVSAEPSWGYEEFEKMFRMGVRGVRFNLLRTNGLPDFRRREMEERLKAAGAAGMHVEILVEEYRLSDVSPLAILEHADIVLDHFAMVTDPRSRYAHYVRDLLSSGRCWVKFSAPFRVRASEISLRRWADSLLEIAPHRLTWGSDWPWVSYEASRFSYRDVFGWLRKWVPDGETRTRILSENPYELLSPIPTRDGAMKRGDE